MYFFAVYAINLLRLAFDCLQLLLIIIAQAGLILFIWKQILGPFSKLSFPKLLLASHVIQNMRRGLKPTSQGQPKKDDPHFSVVYEGRKGHLKTKSSPFPTLSSGILIARASGPREWALVQKPERRFHHG